MGIEDPEAYDSEYNRFWWSAVVGSFVKRFDDYDEDYADEVLQVFSPQFFSSEARKNLESTFGFAKKEYISECLKIFFEDMYDENTGLPVTKSFSKSGSLDNGYTSSVKLSLDMQTGETEIENAENLAELPEFLEN